ncbi:uncharacterized protein MYCFIDRAFT_217103 [Pseudocercospora fijiensis CIRAD86]|uniref:Uncharacterized protein n=1 Tax=Pseudocercospora fijiensis (strain CIRAD86) TaxID=383855 RepID=M2YGW3_PSEFD|nr:uncharacterized protein MYCFIDRAFT_217103 [Pseudocercospora fijiensis CIRAD86]EME77055.1 hypothetical protein MYCFIDRAFT_217103 [Pseudocercospora fijiensis CIRAD86]
MGGKGGKNHKYNYATIARFYCEKRLTPGLALNAQTWSELQKLEPVVVSGRKTEKTDKLKGLVESRVSANMMPNQIPLAFDESGGWSANALKMLTDHIGELSEKDVAFPSKVLLCWKDTGLGYEDDDEDDDDEEYEHDDDHNDDNDSGDPASSGPRASNNEDRVKVEAAQLRRRVDDETANNRKLRKKLKESEEMRTSLEQKLEGDKAKIWDLECRLQKQQEETTEEQRQMQRQIQAVEAKARKSEELQEQVEAEKQDLEKKVSDLQDQAKRTSQQVKTKDQYVQQMFQDRETLRQENTKLALAQGSSDLQKRDLEAMCNQVKHLQAQSQTLANDKSTLEQRLHTSQQEIGALSQKLDDDKREYDTQIQTLETENEQFRTRTETLQEELDSISQHAKLHTLAQEFQARNEDLEQTLLYLERQLPKYRNLITQLSISYIETLYRNLQAGSEVLLPDRRTLEVLIECLLFRERVELAEIYFGKAREDVQGEGKRWWAVGVGCVLLEEGLVE